MFVDRESELEFLNSLPTRTQPSVAQMILLYGRRRVGKTLLVRHWAEITGLPTIYFAAEQEPATLHSPLPVMSCGRTQRSKSSAVT